MKANQANADNQNIAQKKEDAQAIENKSKNSFLSEESLSNNPFLAEGQTSSNPWINPNQVSTNPFLSTDTKPNNPWINPNEGSINPFLPKDAKSLNPFLPVQKKEKTHEIQLKENTKSNSTTSNKNSPETESKMSNFFGTDFLGVNIHKDSDKTSELNAQSFTQSTNKPFAKGEYDTNSQQGLSLLGHELAHIVQQKESKVQPTTQTKGLNGGEETNLETKADPIGEKSTSLSIQKKQENIAENDSEEIIDKKTNPFSTLNTQSNLPIQNKTLQTTNPQTINNTKQIQKQEKETKMDLDLAGEIESNELKFESDLPNEDINSDNENPPPTIQAKLAIGQPNDQYEKEADAVADQVVQKSTQTKSQAYDAIAPKPVKEISSLHISTLYSLPCNLCQTKGKIQLKATQSTEASENIENQINQSKGSGQKLDSNSRQSMENSFGMDFSQVNIHTDSQSVQMNQDLNAKAFTTGSDIYFNQGEYNPQSTDGQHLLAHELTHVVQQGEGKIQTKLIQKEDKLDDSGQGMTISVPLRTGTSDKENIGMIQSLITANVQRVVILGSDSANIYNGQDGKLVQSFKIKSGITVGMPRLFYLWGTNGLFYPILYNIDTSLVSYLGKTKPQTDEEKQIAQQLDKNFTIDNWFESKEETEKFVALINGQVTYFAVTNTSSKAAGGGSEGGGEDVPPKPKWAGAFEKEMDKLLKDVKKTEPTANDVPDLFTFYYSKNKANWRGMGAQKDSSNKLINKVYLDVEEKSDKSKLIEQIRTQIRIEQLNVKQDSIQGKDAKKLNPEMLWAYELKLKLEKRIAEEKKKLTNALDLPDKLTLGMPEENANKVFLQIHVYVEKTDAEGKKVNELKSGSLPEPLRKEMKEDDLFALIRKAVLALKGFVSSSPKSEEKKDKRILAPYPASIIPKNVTEATTVTGATNEFQMRLDFESLEGNDLLHLTTVNMRTVYYAWDIYNVKEQLLEADGDGLSNNWSTRRAQLLSKFESGKQLIGKRAVNEDMLKVYNDMSEENGQNKIEVKKDDPAEKVERLKRMGILYGTTTQITPEAEIKIPKVAGDYLIYCRALVEGTDTIYRLPSERFFPIRVVDGNKLAEEKTKDDSAESIKSLENDLKNATTEKDKKAIQGKIDALKASQALSLKSRTKNEIANNETAINNAKELKELFLKSKKDNALMPFAILEKYPVKKKAGDEDAKDENAQKRSALTELWFLLDTSNQGQSLDEKIDKLIESLNKQVKPAKELSDRIASFDKDINQKGKTYTPIMAMVSEVTGQSYDLITMIGEAPDSNDKLTKVVLVDVTTYKTQGKYYGESTKANKDEALKEAIANAVIAFGEECKYGEGYLAYNIPILGLQGSARSKPGPWQQVKAALETIAMVAGLAALVIGTVASGGALGAAAVALGVGSGLIGAGLAVHNIYDRSQNHRFEYDVEFAMDVLNILGPFLSAAGALSKIKLLSAVKGLDTLDKIAKAEKILKINKGIMLLQKGELVTNITLFGYKVYKDLKEIEDSTEMTPEQKDAMRMQILKNAIIAGVMFTVAIKNEFKPSASAADDAIEQRISKAREQYFDELKTKNRLLDANGKLTLPDGKPITKADDAKVPTDDSSTPKKPADNDVPKIPTEPEVKKPAVADDPKAKETTPDAPKVPVPIAPSPQKKLTTKEYINKHKGALLRGNKDSIKGLLETHGNWKDLITTLAAGGPTEKKVLVEVEKFRLRTSEELKTKFNAGELPGASREAISDIDLNFKGADAGKNVAKAEAEMRALFGDNWSTDLRMNFYSEGRRLTLFSEVANMLGKDAVAAFQKKMTDLTKKYTLAKMFKHAKGNPESEARVQKMIDKIAKGDIAEIKQLSEISTENGLKIRDKLHQEVDALMKEYDTLDAKDPKRAEIAQKVVEKQMEINLHTEEAYIGAGAIPAMDEKLKMVKGDDAMQAVLANLEMIEHIMHQHKGKIVSAGKEYELYKYMYRVSKAISKEQTDFFFDYLNKFVSKMKNKDGSNNRNLPKEFNEKQIELLYADFNNYVNKFMDEQSGSKTADNTPNAPKTPSPDNPNQMGLFDMPQSNKTNPEPDKTLATPTSPSPLKPKGLGSTGRVEPTNLNEQIAMKEITANPEMGKKIAGMIPLKDKRWEGWFKMEYIKRLSNGTHIDIHFNAQFDTNGKMIAIDDFKFKYP